MLINNAASFFEEVSPEQFRAQIEVNFFGALNVTRAVLPVMRRQRSGQIVTISSTAGVVAGEFTSAYAASKFALEGWMEALRPKVAQRMIDRSFRWPPPDCGSRPLMPKGRGSSQSGRRGSSSPRPA